MGDFRSFATASRQPAEALAPVVDPAGWMPETLGAVDEWSYRFSQRDGDALVDAVARARRQGVALDALSSATFPLGHLAELLADVRHELLDGRGIVMLRGFPLDRLDRAGQAMAYIGMGVHLGRPKPQNRHGHLLGHVKDLGGDYLDPTTRGYMTSAELRFHADASDYVGLLCLAEAKSGGASRVASSVTLYNRMLAARPDLVAELTRDFYRSRSGEINPGEAPWITQPVFCFTQGYFSATGVGIAIEKAQALPGVPPFTPAQREAIALYRTLVQDCAVDIAFERGDVQLLNNFVMLHSRRAYEDWPEVERKRHLLRLWLGDPQGRPIPEAQRQGRVGRGVDLAGVKLTVPLDA